MRTLITVSIAVVVAAGAMLFAGNTNPPAGPISGTMKTLQQVEPRIPIESLPLDITQPGSYYLTGDLSTASYGIRIRSSDVTIDLMGFTITGSDPTLHAAIELLTSNEENITVRNGTVRTFNRGVQLFTGSQSERGMRIIDVRAMDVGDSGLTVGGINSMILDSFAQRSQSLPVGGDGIACVGGVMQNCSAYGFANGIIANAATAENCVARLNDYGLICIGSVMRGCTGVGNITQNLFFSSGLQVDNYAP